MTDLTISIVSTKENNILDRCLCYLFESISNEIAYEIFVVDNADNISGSIKEKYPDIKMIVNKEQKGFSENHNNVIRQSQGKFVLVMNPDVFVTKGFVEELIRAMEEDHKIGCITGKLLSGEPGSGKRIFDSTGGIVFKSRRTADRGQGMEDIGQYDKLEEVFYASGSAILCRREALEDVKLFGDYFDESFFIYKEELDLCWRARLRGWKIMYDPKAFAYHLRGWGTETERKQIPAFIRRHSYKNRYLMILKDDHASNIFKGLPFIFWHEIKALVYMIFREPQLFLAWPQMIRLLPQTLRKRREIMKRAVIGPSEMRKWFV